MLGTAAAILLCLLPSQVHGLSAVATCLIGYEWMFSSIGQSPCDVAVELATVCYSTTYQLYPLNPSASYYSAPLKGYQSDNNCLCSSVYYSMLSACTICQSGNYFLWSIYITGCTSYYPRVYPYPIPAGVRVPAYAYLDVSVDDQFNAIAASGLRGVESTRSISSSTQALTPTLSSFSSVTASSSSTSTTTAAAIGNAPSPGMVGGVVVGGLAAIGLITALITFLVLRSKRKSRSQNYNSGLQQSPSMAFSTDTPASLIHSGMVHNANDQDTFVGPNIYDPYRQHSPPLNTNMTPHFTGNSTQNHAPPQTSPQNTSGHYAGMPEL